jgi:DNA-binding transcriptional ArsR family regulator
MPNQPKQIDRVFQALGDPTRREVVKRLCRGPAPVTELASGFKMALPSFTQHLGVLERSGLVQSSKKGRVRTYFLVPGPLEKVENWISKRRSVWEKRLDQLDNYLLNMKENTK